MASRVPLRVKKKTGKSCSQSLANLVLGVVPANQTKERSVHELFAGTNLNQSSMCELCLFSQGKTPEFTKKGEIHELFVSAPFLDWFGFFRFGPFFGLVWFAGATPEFCLRHPFARNFCSKNGISAISFAKPFAVASAFDSQWAILFLTYAENLEKKDKNPVGKIQIVLWRKLPENCRLPSLVVVERILRFGGYNSPENFRGQHTRPISRNTPPKKPHLHEFEKFASIPANFPVTWVWNAAKIVQKNCSDDYFGWVLSEKLYTPPPPSPHFGQKTFFKKNPTRQDFIRLPLSSNCTLSRERPVTVGSEVLKQCCFAWHVCFSLYARQGEALLFCARQALTQSIRACTRLHEVACATGRYMLVQFQTAFSCVPCAQVLGSPLSCDFKSEVLSITQLEAMAEKQPRSRKGLSMLYTDKQLCLASERTHSSAEDPVGHAEIRAIAIHSLGAACFASHHWESTPQHNSSWARWQCLRCWLREGAGWTRNQSIIQLSNCARSWPLVEELVHLHNGNNRTISCRIWHERLPASGFPFWTQHHHGDPCRSGRIWRRSQGASHETEFD